MANGTTYGRRIVLNNRLYFMVNKLFQIKRNSPVSSGSVFGPEI